MNNNLRLPKEKLNNIKLVVSDLDGTALNEDKKFSEASVGAFLKLKEKNIMFTIASARTPAMMGVFCMQAGISNCPVITLEGACIVEWNTGKVLFEQPIEPDTSLPVMKFCHENGYDYTIYTSLAGYLRHDTKRGWRFKKYNDLAALYGQPFVKTCEYEKTDPSNIANEKVYKIFIDNPSEQEKEKLISYLKNFDDVKTDCSEGGSITIMHREVSKRAALEKVASYLRIDRNQVCCFGDWFNDIEMLINYPNSVAMLNGVAEAKNAAAYVTKSNSDDGVAFFINTFII